MFPDWLTISRYLDSGLNGFLVIFLMQYSFVLENTDVNKWSWTIMVCRWFIMMVCSCWCHARERCCWPCCWWLLVLVLIGSWFLLKTRGFYRVFVWSLMVLCVAWRWCCHRSWMGPTIPCGQCHWGAPVARVPGGHRDLNGFRHTRILKMVPVRFVPPTQPLGSTWGKKRWIICFKSCSTYNFRRNLFVNLSILLDDNPYSLWINIY